MPALYMSQSTTSMDHQLTNYDRLKPVLTADLVNMSIDRHFANLFHGKIDRLLHSKTRYVSLPDHIFPV